MIEEKFSEGDSDRMKYRIPEPSENPIAALVMYYKISKGVEYDDRIWDKINWGRWWLRLVITDTLNRVCSKSA